MTDRIDCKTKLNYNGERIGTTIEPNQNLLSTNTNGFIHEDKLRFILDTTIEADKAYGIRDLPFMISETTDKYIQGNYWTALTNGEIGIAYFNKGAMGTVNESGRFSIPLAYANQYVWGGRMLYGEYENEFSIYPFMGKWEEADLHKKAIEYQFPFSISKTFGKQNGELSDSATLFNIIDENNNLMLSALYPEDSSIIARFYEYKGDNGSLTINNNIAKLKYEVNIMGEYVGEVDKGKSQFSKRCIKSFRLE
jgi:alpha-mannosidase